MRRHLSPIDRQVMRVIHGPKAVRINRRITVRGIEKKTGLSAMAIILSVYRLTGLGLVNSQPRPMPKRVDQTGSLPHRPRAGRSK
jgi:hypothetical protein